MNAPKSLSAYILPGNASAQTHEENQSAIHYAAKYNAVTSLKVLIEHRVDYNARDYKGRTPLFLAAETGKPLFPSFMFYVLCFSLEVNYPRNN